MSTATIDFDDLLTDLDDAIAGPIEETPPAESAPAVDRPAEKFPPRHRATCPKGTLFFDLETIPDYSREELFGLASVPTPAVYAGENDGHAPSELVAGTEDEVKARIAKAQSGGKLIPRVILDAAIGFERKRDKGPRKGVLSMLDGMVAAIDGEASRIQAAVDGRRKSMAVSPEMNRIVVFGYAWENDPAEAMTFRRLAVMEEKFDLDLFEKQCLEKFWELSRRAKTVVGFNVLNFDLPTIFNRSILHGVAPGKIFDMKPWGSDVVDIMAKRWPKGGQMKLKDYARVMGIPIPAGDVDGSQVEELIRTNPDAAGEYCRSDVSITRELYLMGRGFYW